MSVLCQVRESFLKMLAVALTLKSAVETSAKYAAIPDNLGRANATANQLQKIMEQGKGGHQNLPSMRKAAKPLLAKSGNRTLDPLFRIISAAALAAPGRRNCSG